MSTSRRPVNSAGYTSLRALFAQTDKHSAPAASVLCSKAPNSSICIRALRAVAYSR